jgi:hypothetical protein
MYLEVNLIFKLFTQVSEGQQKKHSVKNTNSNSKAWTESVLHQSELNGCSIEVCTYEKCNL